VEQELESDLRIASLPDCATSKGSRLASLRPPITHQVYVPPSRPFRPIENTISANSVENGYAHLPLELVSAGAKLQLSSACCDHVERLVQQTKAGTF
jgi:hypothetical protein